MMIQNLKPKEKLFLALIHDISAISFSFYTAFALRHGELLPPEARYKTFPLMLAIAIITQLSCLAISGAYKSIYRFSSIPDLIKIFKGSSLGLIATMLVIFFTTRLDSYPRGAFFINWSLLLISLGSGRLTYRILSDYKQNRSLQKDQNKKNVLIIGAGKGGEKLLRDIKYSPDLKLQVVGFIDDDLDKLGRSIHGVRVLGKTSQIRKLCDRLKVNVIFIAIPKASSEDIREIVSRVNNPKVTIKTLPRFEDILYGRIEFSQLRDIEPEDLLGRSPVTLNHDEIREFIKDKNVLVTGAGGSIGSEIVMQVLKHSPRHLLGFEQNELSVYELQSNYCDESNATFKVGDVRNFESVNSIIAKFKPDVIFHAAAYKHVPLMEENPLEAIKTNVIGTKNVALASINNKVKKVVLISTDKAVNPTNIMGTTKRIAELICLYYGKSSPNSSFTTIRFGNVLGSSGSVIPKFKKQIARGGPVTITHPDIERFFMSIPEACQLVLQAGALPTRNQIMVLDMGSPVKILSLAKQLITLSGHEPEKDIKIEFTGLRPGEKMYEEIFDERESRIPTSNKKIYLSESKPLPENFEVILNELYSLDFTSSKQEIIFTLKKLIPEFNHQSNCRSPENTNSLH